LRGTPVLPSAAASPGCHGMSGVNRVVLTIDQPLPVYPDQRTSPDQPVWSVSCQWATSHDWSDNEKGQQLRRPVSAGGHMTFFVNAVVIVFYAIAACAIYGAIVVQLKFMSAAGLSLPILISKPWKALVVMADHNKVFASPGQIKRFVIFGLLLFTAFAAFVSGRSIQLGHSPF
jgi:hypothetical protein